MFSSAEPKQKAPTENLQVTYACRAHLCGGMGTVHSLSKLSLAEQAVKCLGRSEGTVVYWLLP